jgi:gamma-glutamylcyclotransferase (GGCT)/AIG2-like uncharacterized protein YtfP
MIHRIFVYGTLAPEGQMLKSSVTWLANGRMHPSVVILFKQVWGAEQGYPRVVLDAEGCMVEGFVFLRGQTSGC